MNKFDHYVEVIVDSGFSGTLTYRDDSGRVSPGDLVIVPYKNQHNLSVVLATDVEKPNIKAEKIKSVIDDSAVPLPDDLFELIKTLKRYYFGSAREIMRTVRHSLVALAEYHTHYFHINSPDSPTPLQEKVLVAVNSGLNQWDIEELSVKAASTLNNLVELGYLKKRIGITPTHYVAQSNETLSDINLSEAQRQSLTGIVESSTKPILFWGDTGSGKTVVLCQYYREFRAKQGQWLILLPEIALLTQISERIAELTDKRIGVYHGSLSDAQKKKVIKATLRGDVDIVIGTRSAIFLPFAKLGLITVDECHDRSYKDAQSCRYNARDLAVLRASSLNIPVVLASATPDLESIEHTRSDKYSVVRLTERFGEGQLAEVKIIDSSKEPHYQGVSIAVLRSLESALNARQQSLIFINRKGYAPVFLCGDCNWKAECPNCSARLAWFKEQHQLKCHACGYQATVDNHCPNCQSANLIPLGLATERVEAIIREQLPHARVIRVDRESVQTQEDIAAAIQKIEQHEVDIIVSTQILAKAVNFEHLNFVAVLDIDQGLLSLDPKATEYSGQQVIQVLGRAGRFTKGSSALIQSSQVERKELQYMKNQDWDGFSDFLLTERYLASLPPFAASLVLRGEHKKQTSIDKAFDEVYLLLQQCISDNNWIDEINASMPFAARIERVNQYHRRIIFITARQRKTRNGLINRVASRLEDLLPRNQFRWHIDVDPIELG